MEGRAKNPRPTSRALRQERWGLVKEVAGRAVMVAWAVAGVVAVVAPQVQILGLKQGHDSNGG